MEQQLEIREEEDNIYTGIIYPNFNKANKWLGIIDYKSLVVLLIYIVMIWNITGAFTTNIIIKGYVIIITIIPIITIFYTYLNEDSIIDVLYIILKFYLSPKIYVYMLK